MRHPKPFQSSSLPPSCHGVSGFPQRVRLLQFADAKAQSVASWDHRMKPWKE